MGELLRRYWHPIAATAELDVDPVRPVRLLGEDLVLFRNERGELGLVGDHLRPSHYQIRVPFDDTHTLHIRFQGSCASQARPRAPMSPRSVFASVTTTGASMSFRLTSPRRT